MDRLYSYRLPVTPLTTVTDEGRGWGDVRLDRPCRYRLPVALLTTRIDNGMGGWLGERKGEVQSGQTIPLKDIEPNPPLLSLV